MAGVEVQKTLVLRGQTHYGSTAHGNVSGKSGLIEELLVVRAVIFVFLLHVRSAIIPIVILPLAVLLSFIPMVQQQLTANIMSLGGIAVAIGAMVDASIIIIENIHKKLEAWESSGRHGKRQAVIIEAMQEVGPTIFFSLLVIMISFLPVFTLEATEGRLFRPLAYTKTYSMGFAAVLGVTLVPALAVLLIRGRAYAAKREIHSIGGSLQPTRPLCVLWFAIAGS